MASLLQEHSTGDSTEYLVRLDDERLAQTFEHSVDFKLSWLELLLWKAGTPGTNLVVEIYPTIGSPAKPTGSAIYSTTLAVSGISAVSPGTWKMILTNNTPLLAGVQYAIVLGPDVADWGAGNTVNWRQDAAPAGYANGNGADENAGVWGAYTFDYMFKVYGTVGGGGNMRL